MTIAQKPLLCLLLLALSPWPGTVDASSTPKTGYFDAGVAEYKAGHFVDAMGSFENAIKFHERAKEAQQYLDQIRKETVEAIRNKALAGISKDKWQSKFYFINTLAGHLMVGISAPELFEPDSLNYRAGAVDALQQLATLIQHNESSTVEIQLINELNEGLPTNPDLVSQRLSEVLSFLSLSARNQLPKYNAPVAPLR